MLSTSHHGRDNFQMTLMAQKCRVGCALLREELSRQCDDLCDRLVETMALK
jgi:hypothetical protein